jgi:outer membrane protein TolC
MRVTSWWLSALVLVAVPVSVGAQERLPLSQAVAAVLEANPAIRAARAAADEAASQVPQARAGLLPRLDVTESWQRGNQPVFVFSSLLAQRQFAEANFDIGQLNDPDPLGHFRTALTVEQRIFDGGRTTAGVRAAELGHEIARATARQTERDLELAATRAYGHVLVSAALQRAAESAVTAAEADVRTAADRRDVGVGTEADVLALQVHLARMRARAIDARAEVRVGRAALNRLMGVALDRAYTLEEPALAPPVIEPLDARVGRALEARPESRRAAFEAQLAREMVRSARAAFLPEVVVQGAYEWNGGTFADRASAWTVGLQARLNLFAGGADLARRRAAESAVRRADAAREDVDTGIRFSVLSAVERMTSSSARQLVGTATVAQARESERMIRDRYEAGLAGVTEVLRAADALLDAETLRISAVVDAMVDRAVLAHAIAADEVLP